MSGKDDGYVQSDYLGVSHFVSPCIRRFLMANKFDLCHEYPLFSELSIEQMNAVRKICKEECFYPGYTLFED